MCLPHVEFVRTPTYGGPDGYDFDDTSALRYNERIHKIGIRSLSTINKIEFSTQFNIYGHGGGGGGYRTMNLGSREKIAKIEICWGPDSSIQVFFVKFDTNFGKSIQGGTRTNTCATTHIPSDRVVVGMYGNSAAEMHRIGFVHRLQLC